MKILLFLLLVGCSTHQSSMYSGGTYHDELVSPNIYDVTFAGDSNATLAQVKEMLRLRSSEIAIQNTFKYFIVLQDAYKVERLSPTNARMAVRAEDYIYTNRIQLTHEPLEGKTNFNAEEIFQSHRNKR
jgi:hypothetical protein